jgi:hypothetical protein
MSQSAIVGSPFLALASVQDVADLGEQRMPGKKVFRATRFYCRRCHDAGLQTLWLFILDYENSFCPKGNRRDRLVR